MIDDPIPCGDMCWLSDDDMRCGCEETDDDQSDPWIWAPIRPSTGDTP